MKYTKLFLMTGAALMLSATTSAVANDGGKAHQPYQDPTQPSFVASVPNAVASARAPQQSQRMQATLTPAQEWGARFWGFLLKNNMIRMNDSRLIWTENAPKDDIKSGVLAALNQIQPTVNAPAQEEVRCSPLPQPAASFQSIHPSLPRAGVKRFRPFELIPSAQPQPAMPAQSQIVPIGGQTHDVSETTALSLDDKDLTEATKEIEELSKLTSRNLSYNQITGLPTEIEELSKLKSLHCYSRDLSEVPESIMWLSALTGVDLHNNQLTELPEAIAHLHYLEWLDLHGNKLQQVLPEIFSSPSLKHINLRENNITSLHIPACASSRNVNLLAVLSDPLDEIFSRRPLSFRQGLRLSAKVIQSKENWWRVNIEKGEISLRGEFSDYLQSFGIDENNAIRYEIKNGQMTFTFKGVRDADKLRADLEEMQPFMSENSSKPIKRQKSARSAFHNR